MEAKVEKKAKPSLIKIKVVVKCSDLEFQGRFFISKLSRINMMYESDRGFTPRETVKGNWKCSDCGVEITELPFEPAQDRPIYCKECWAKRKPKRDFNR